MFVLERVADVTVLRVSAVAAALAYPGFLLAPGPAAKLAILAVLSAATAPWYPLLQARLYGSLPGRSPVAVTLSSAAGLAGGLGPLAVGLIAEGARAVLGAGGPGGRPGRGPGWIGGLAGRRAPGPGAGPRADRPRAPGRGADRAAGIAGPHTRWRW